MKINANNPQSAPFLIIGADCGVISKRIYQIADAIIGKLLAVLLITISAAIYLMILIIEIEDMRQLLLDGGDAARVLAVDHVL